MALTAAKGGTRAAGLQTGMELGAQEGFDWKGEDWKLKRSPLFTYTSGYNPHPHPENQG